MLKGPRPQRPALPEAQTSVYAWRRHGADGYVTVAHTSLFMRLAPDGSGGWTGFGHRVDARDEVVGRPWRAEARSFADAAETLVRRSRRRIEVPELADIPWDRSVPDSAV